MKKLLLALAILFAASSVTPSFAYDPPGRKKKQVTTKKYTCPMHPEVVTAKPGKCPKCGMKLELQKKTKTTTTTTK